MSDVQRISEAFNGAIASRLTTERPSFRTIAASRRHGWTPAHDPANWPDDPAMIPQSIRLHTTAEFTSGHQGATLPGWFAGGGTQRKVGISNQWPKRPAALPWEREAAS